MTTDHSGEVPRLGDYRLHGVLGEGGMGVVHLGVDPSGRAVAVKVLRDHVAHDATARARLAREVATLRRVDHPAIAPFLGADVDGERPYIVTRYIAGDPLDAWVAEHGSLSGEALRGFALTLIDALEAIHRAGVVHRDLKPANVLMPAGSPVVIDFGIAHVADESRLTSTGLVMGTPGYLAPELLDGHDVSVATDLWGLAATIAFAATGRSPFGSGHSSAVLDRVRRGATDLTGVPPRLADLLQDALEVDPSRRPPLSAMRAVLADPSTDLSPPEETRDVDPRTQVVAAVPPEAPTEAVPRPSLPPTQPVPGPATPPTEAVQAPARPDRPWGRGAHRAPDERSAAVEPATAAHPVVTTRVMPVVPPPRREPPQPAYAAFESRPAPQTRAPAPAAFGPARQAPGHGPSGPERVGGPAVGPVGPPQGGAVSRRAGTLFAVGLMLLALITYLPGLGVLVALGWSWSARFVDRLVTSVALRRAARGVRDRDVPMAVLTSPWHLLGSGLSAVVTALLPLFVGLGFGVGLHALSGDVAGLPTGTASTVAIGAAAGLVVAWWGPGSGTLRRGSRSIVRGVAPGRPGAAVAVGVLVCAAAVLGLLTQSSGWDLTWWPLGGAWEWFRAVTRW